MEISTHERIALIKDFAGIQISTFETMDELFERLIPIYFCDLRRRGKYEPQEALQIIVDVVNRQKSLIKKDWNLCEPESS